MSVSPHCFYVLAVAKALFRNIMGLDNAASILRVGEVFLDLFMTFSTGIVIA